MRGPGLPASLSKQQSMLSITGSCDQVYQRPTKYIPDFGVKATNATLYLRIRRSHYIAARRATLLERAPKAKDMESAEDPFAKEWKRAISVDPDHQRGVGGATSDGEASSLWVNKGSRETLTSPSFGHDDRVVIVDGRTRSETNESLDCDRSTDADTPLMISSCENMEANDNDKKNVKS